MGLTETYNKARDIKGLLFTNANYLLEEKKKLNTMCHIATNIFKDHYHESAFKQLNIEVPIPNKAIENHELKLQNFQQDGSHLFNAEVKEITNQLEAYVGNSAKASSTYRVNKIIFMLLHNLTVTKLFKERYDSSSEIKKRVKEVQNIQDWIGGIIESQTPNFIEDTDFLNNLKLTNRAFNKIIARLTEEKIKLERKDILESFEGENHLKNIINSVAEYISSLPGNNKGFSALELFQKAAIANSDVQKFLIGTNIGKATLSIFLIDENAKKLFASNLDTTPIHYLIAGVDLKLELNTNLWEVGDTKNLIANSLLLLGQFAGAAEIATGVKNLFSGVTGNVGLLTPDIKGSIIKSFSMTSEGLLKLQDLIKGINEEVLKSPLLSGPQEIALGRLERTCNSLVDEAIENYKKVLGSIAQAPGAQELISKFKIDLANLEAITNSFQIAILPLLSPEKQKNYEILNTNNNALEGARVSVIGDSSITRTSIENNNMLALPAAQAHSSTNLEYSKRKIVVREIKDDVTQTEEKNEIGESFGVQLGTSQANIPSLLREVDDYKSDYMAKIARGYLQDSHPNLISEASFLETHKAKIIAAFKKHREDNIVAIKDNANQSLEKWLINKNDITNLKKIGAIGSAIMAPSIAGVATGMTLHYTSWVALSGVTAVAPWGAVTAAAVGTATLIIAGGIAAYRVYHMSEEERGNRSTFSLWLSEVGNCFTFNKEYMRNQYIYSRVCNWSGGVYKCLENLIKLTEENIDFTLKVLEAVLFYLPSQNKFLVEESSPEKSKKEQILNQAIKLRYTFLKLIQENKLYYIEGVKIETETHEEENFPINYSYKLREKDTDIIEATKTAFICLIYGAIEHLKIKKEELLKSKEPSTSLIALTTREVINKYIGRN